MKKYLIALSALAFATTSCYEKLNIAPPNNITNEMVQELLETADETTVVTILGAIADALPPHVYGSGYNTRYSNGLDHTWSGQLAMRSLTGNDIAYGYLSQPENIYYNCGNLTDPDDLEVLSFWHRAFTMTTQANKMFNVLTPEILEANDLPILRDYYGRGLILRAFGYLYAMENFGTNSLGMPIYTTYSFDQPEQSRVSALETYDSIIRWATEADEMFEVAGVGFKATDNSQFTRGLTNYVIARACLLAADAEGATASNYLNQAIAACDRMIQSGASFMNEDQYVQKADDVPYTEDGKDYPIYRAESSGFMNFALNPEALYGFGWQYGGGGSIVSYGNFLTSSCRIDDRLYDLIDPRDYRRDNFHTEYGGLFYAAGSGSFIDAGTTTEVSTYWTTKFANNVGLTGEVGANNVTQQNRADFAFVRLSEAYLMKAEAQAKLGDDGQAQATLNTLLAARTRAGETAMTCTDYSGMQGLSTLEMVQLQTRIEMWGEKGLEWFNNRRWNIPVNRVGSTVHWNTSSSYSVENMTLPIPTEELQGSPNFGPLNPTN